MDAFKVDQISFVYFFPGLIVTFGVLAVTYDLVPEPRASEFRHLDGTVALALLAALSYAVGYACWILGDQWPRVLAYLQYAWMSLRQRPEKERRSVDRAVAARGTVGRKAWHEVFRYICHDDTLREYYRLMLHEGYYIQLGDTLRQLYDSGVFADETTGKAPQECSGCKSIIHEGRSDYCCVQHRLSRDLLDAHGRRLWLLIWDWAYNRDNQYHIGRLISSWNNLKFLKASVVACIVALLVFVVRVLWGAIFCKGCGNSVTWTTAVLLFILWFVFHCIGVPWRRRAWVRDLVHSLAPYCPKDHQFLK